MKKTYRIPMLTGAAGLAIAAAANAQVTNGDFETGDLTGWTITGTNPPPVNDSTTFHGGAHSALLGTNVGTEPLGDGSMYQALNVPAVNPGFLTFWYKTFTTDSITFDWQDAYIQDAAGNTLATIFHVCQTADWTRASVDMTPYAGQTIRIAFLVHQDGFGDDTSMNVDDVALGQLVTGACCVTSGCVVTDSVGCAGQGGVYRGDGSTCATANCPQPCPPITGMLVTGPATWPVTHVSLPARLFRDGIPDTCAAPGTASSFAGGPFNADVYHFQNNSGQAVCVNFTLTAQNQCNLYAGAYTPSFDPNNVVTNNIASTGVSTAIPPAPISMSFNVAAGAIFQIVVNDANPVGVSTCADSYTFQIGGGTLSCSPTTNTCYPNCDHSTTAPCLNVLDFGCFLNAFASGDTYANCDNSTTAPVLNVLDFGCFLNAFAAGCTGC